MGHDLLALLAHNEIPYVLVEKEACCGMPKLELGDLEGVDALKDKEYPGAGEARARGLRDPDAGALLHADVQAGAAADVSRTTPTSQAVRDAMFDPFEYFVLRSEGRAAEEATSRTQLGKVSYHIPCHSRVQNVGQKTREMLEIDPRHRGDHGRALRRPRRHLGREERVLRQLDEDRPAGVPPDGRAPKPDYVSSDCPIAARHIMQGMGEARHQRREGPPAYAAAQGLRHLDPTGTDYVFSLVRVCAAALRLLAGVRATPFRRVRRAGRRAVHRGRGRSASMP